MIAKKSNLSLRLCVFPVYTVSVALHEFLNSILFKLTKISNNMLPYRR